MKDQTIHEEARSRFHKERLVVLSLAGTVALNYPLLQIFDNGKLWFGIPLLYLYLFGVWTAVIFIGAWALERGTDIKPKAEELIREEHPES